MKKFVVHPGYIISPEDGDYHWIPARRLMDLYHVNPAECIVDDGHLIGYSEHYLKRLLHLYPRTHWYVPVSENERSLYPIP